jgi:hypothetical protein
MVPNHAWWLYQSDGEIWLKGRRRDRRICEIYYGQLGSFVTLKAREKATQISIEEDNGSPSRAVQMSCRLE